MLKTRPYPLILDEKGATPAEICEFLRAERLAVARKSDKPTQDTYKALCVRWGVKCA